VRTSTATPLRFDTGDGRVVYALCLEVFPRFYGNVYVLEEDGRFVMVDTGSGFEASNRNLEAGLASIEESFGRRIRIEDLSCVLVTHAHIDHFGGLQYVRQRTPAPVGIHPLDWRVLSHYEERVVMASKQLRVFLQRAGVSSERQERLMQMYLAPKGRFSSLPADFLIEEGRRPAFTATDGNTIELELEVIHAPGHCPGQVCLRAGEILLCADHVLARTTPHQAPESITLHMGLSHYFDSLERVRRFGAARGVRLALGGHEEPIEDLDGRIGAIRASHDQRLDQVLELCGEPSTLSELSHGLFEQVRGYNVLLALEETGAHVEYLYQRGGLVASNLAEIERETEPVIRYARP
jgi:glyoxylase-like metal-dependent hydrolase (beta-lactamase superfamily II)